MTLCSKPNGIFSQLPFDIPTTHAFIRCTAAVAARAFFQTFGGRTIDRNIDGILGASALRFVSRSRWKVPCSCAATDGYLR